MKLFYTMVVTIIMASCALSPAIKPAIDQKSTMNHQSSSFLDNDRTKAIDSTIFNRRGLQRLYFLRDKETTYYIDSVGLNYISITGGSFSIDQYNSFIKGFNIDLRTISDADYFIDEFNQLFLQRELVINKDDLKRRFTDDDGLINSISTLKAIGQWSDRQGFDLLFYTVDEYKLYRNTMSLTKGALFAIYKVEPLNLGLPYNSF